MRLLTCLHPVSGWRVRGINPKTGRKYGLLSAEDARHYPSFLLEEVAFRCGKCFNCLKYRGSVLLARCVAECRLHDDNAFITLTVDDANIETVFPGRSLSHRPWQLFCKRLRKKCSKPIKFMMCGEYGEQSLRPHYHAVIFGLAPYEYIDTGVRLSDGRPACRLRCDNHVFADCWSFGNVYCGRAEEASIAYVSGYTLKQYTLGRDDTWYVDRGLSSEYVKWSRRPGLGASYFDRYDLIDDCKEVSCGVPLSSGRRLFAGRYYLDRLRLTHPEDYDKLLSSYDGEDGECDYSPAEFSELLASRNSRVDYFVHSVRNARRI